MKNVFKKVFTSIWIQGALCLVVVACTPSTHDETLRVVKKQCLPVPSENLEVELAACVTGKARNYKIGRPYRIKGRLYRPKENFNHKERGVASWYGPKFHNKKTANGERFNQNDMTAAHRTLQIPCYVQVTNLDNGRKVILRVNDRGPYAKDRCLDVSKAAAKKLGFIKKGTANVEVVVLREPSMIAAGKLPAPKGGKKIMLASNNAKDSPVVSARKLKTNSAHNQQRSSVKMLSIKPRKPARLAQAPKRISATPLQSESETADAPKRGSFYLPGRAFSNAQQHLAATNGKIYIQAGSFSDPDNAAKFSDKLSSFGESSIRSALINGREYFRVRLGPIATIGAADSILEKVIGNGYDEAIIIIES